MCGVRRKTPLLQPLVNFRLAKTGYRATAARLGARVGTLAADAARHNIPERARTPSELQTRCARCYLSSQFHSPRQMTAAIEARTEQAPLLGWWQLVSCEVEFQASGHRAPMYDTPTNGFLVFASDGRVMTVVEALRRDEPARDPESAHGMAYAGRYRVEGQHWLTEIDAACNVGWRGAIQERWFRIESDRLHVRSGWCVSPPHGGATIRVWLVWQRPTATAA